MKNICFFLFMLLFAVKLCSMEWANENLKDWKVVNYNNYKINNSGFVGTTYCILGKITPHLFSPTLNLKAENYNLLEIQIKSEKNGIGRMFFAPPNKGFSEAMKYDFTTPNTSGEWKNIYIPLNNKLWHNKIAHIRLDLLFANNVKINVRKIRFIKDDNIYKLVTSPKCLWKADEISNWTCQNYNSPKYNIDGFSGKTICIAGKITPHIHSPKLNINASDFNLLEIKMKSNKNGIGRLFFAPANQAYLDSMKIDYSTPNTNGQWEILSIPLTHKNWEGKIDKIRLDLIFVNNVDIQIQKIRFLKINKSPDELLNNTSWTQKDVNDKIIGWNYNSSCKSKVINNGIKFYGTGKFELSSDNIYFDFTNNNSKIALTANIKSRIATKLNFEIKLYNALEQLIEKKNLIIDTKNNLNCELSLPLNTLKCNFSIKAPIDNNEIELTDFSLKEKNNKEFLWTGQWIQPSPLKKQFKNMFFAKNFNITEDIKDAYLAITADNVVEKITINENNVPLGNNAKIYNGVDNLNIKKYLKKGKNFIRIEASNLDIMGGLIADLDIKLDSGKIQSIGTDASWKAVDVIPKDWEKNSFNIKSLPNALALGYTENTIWGYLDKYPQLTSKSKHKTLEEINAKIIFNENKAASVKTNHGKLPLLHHWAGAISTLTPQKINFCKDNNIHWYFGTTTAAWTNNNFSIIDKYCEKLLSIDNKAMLNLLIAVDQLHDHTQKDWADKHPEIFAKDDKGKTKFSIHSRKDATVPTWSSQTWLNKQCKNLKALVNHIQNGPYKDRIVGLLPVSGNGFEWLNWGSYDTGGGIYRMGYSESFKDAFQKWLEKKYKNITSINQRYNTNYNSFKEITVPTVKERDNGDWFGFLDVNKSAKVIDFRKFISQNTTNAILKFAKTIKETSNEKLLFGTFYGYMTYVTFPHWSETGHFDLGRILKSKDVDFLTSLTRYDTRIPGLEGGWMHPEASFLLNNKASFVQVDTRTHRVGPKAPDANYSRCKNITESISVIKREFINSLIAGVGYEFGYLGNGWISQDARIMQVIGRAQEIELASKNINRLDKKSSIAVIVDEKSTYYTAQKSPMHNDIVTKQLIELAHAGCGLDTYLLMDLEKLPDYNCYIFLNTFVLSHEQEKFINEKLKKDNKTLVFIYSPGIIKNEKIVPERVAQITDIKTLVCDKKGIANVNINQKYQQVLGKSYGLNNEVAPIFVPQEGEVLGCFKDSNKPALVRKKFDNHTIYYSSIPHLSAQVIRHIAKGANVNIANSNLEDSTYATDSLIGIHSPNGGLREIIAPNANYKKATELFTNKEYKINNGKFYITLDKISSVLLKMEY